MTAHVHEATVYYEDTDASGLVYHASYLRFAERARTEMLRGYGFAQSQLWDKAGIAFVVRRAVVDFRSPARLDDHLLVHTWLTKLHGASFDMQQVIHRNETVLVQLTLKLACICRNGRPMRLPDELRDRLSFQPEQGVERTYGE